MLEGLREEALELARDTGVESLTEPGGLKKFIEKMREAVFCIPTRSRRDTRTVLCPTVPGTLARQAGETMLSYVSRRRRWWKLLKTLDTSIELSEPMRVE